MPLPRVTRKRRIVQGILIAVALLLPFVTISGKPFLRMDIAKMTLFFVGEPLRIDQFYLVLLLTLLFVALFLLVTAVLGRVWCGWLCPQTVLNDLAELCSRLFQKNVSHRITRLAGHVFALIIAKIMAFNLFCWFIPPAQVAADLLHFFDHRLMFAAFAFVTLVGYLNLVLVKRSFCSSYCPYGRFQAALMDAGTLNLSFLEETRDRCLRCNACVRTCPMGIDIRAGFQIECIGCGRCIDACRSVMENTPDGVGLIDYRFGTMKGTAFKLGNTSAVLLLLTLLLAAGLFWGIMSRSQAAFAAQRIATAESRRLPDGSVAHPWKAIIGNRSEAPRVYAIRIAPDSSGGAELLGQVRDLRVAANQHLEVSFMIHVAKNSRQPEKLVLQLLDGDRAAVTATVLP